MPNEDKISQSIYALEGDDIQPRTMLSESEKVKLIEAVGGPLTARSIVKAKSEFSLARIPWLFSSIDPQLVVDILANEMDDLIAKGVANFRIQKKSRKKTS